VPVRKARSPAVAVKRKPAKATSKSKAVPRKPAKAVPKKPAKAKSVNRSPAVPVPEPIMLTTPGVAAAAWNVVLQVRHLHIWRPRGRSCECRLCTLTHRLQTELLRSGSKDPEDTKVAVPETCRVQDL
jgi:hypothetical protein